MSSGVAASRMRVIIISTEASSDLAEEIDELLRRLAKSELIDPDPESEERAKAREKRMKELKNLAPGKWRGRNF
jgi:hypothetical protein